MSEALKKFGKFFLLDQIAQGGMAEIYRARMATPDGGGRLLAVKRIIQSYSSNAEFVKMFKDEIKTTSGFTHPNIVQLYDYGEEEGLFYIAMELVDGKNLRQFTGRFSELKQTFPIEVSVYIMEQATHGMAYAHGYKDKISGKSLNIVHRDISPQNLLISYDGAVKVIDFGIAKVATNAEATRAGIIKGKPSYLSPEQISGDALDGRSDIFALGIVLWELLTGKKLFASDNDYGVLKLIENCQNHVKPPSMHNPKVTKELDAIVLKCLQKNRDQRYQSAEEMQRALHKFLYQFAPEFNPADLAYYARDLFKNEIVEDRKRLLKLNEKFEQIMSTQTQAGKAISGKEESTVAITKTDVGNQPPPALEQSGKVEKEKEKTGSGSFRMVEFDHKDKSDIKLEYGEGMPPAHQQNTRGSGFNAATTGTQSIVRPKSGMTASTTTETKSSKSPFAAVALLALAAGGYYYYSEILNPQSSQPQQAVGDATLQLEGNIKAATVKIDDRVVASEFPAQISNLPSKQPLKLVVTANGYKKFTQSVILGPADNKLISVQMVREDSSSPQLAGGAAAEGKPVTLSINITPAGFGNVMKLNGMPIDVSGVSTAPTDTPLDLVVERDGFRTVHKRFTISSAALGAKTEYSVNVTLEPAKFGYVSIKTTPSAEAIVEIDGVEERWPTPVSRKRVPIGNYKIKLVNSLLGMEKEISLNVSEDRFTNVEERLTVDQKRAPGSR